MGLQLGSVVPDFVAETTAGRLRFHDWLGDSWGVLFSHPRDFTPVCTTELGQVARLKDEFDRRGCKVIGLSCDSVEDHVRWSRDIEQTQGVAPNFPMIADADGSIARAYDMLDADAQDTMTVRSVFIVGPDKRLKLSLTYPASTGRNFDEVLRVIDSLQLTARHKLATPANWKPGEDCIIVPAVSNEDARKMFGEFREIRPYLRTTPMPKA